MIRTIKQEVELFRDIQKEKDYSFIQKGESSFRESLSIGDLVNSNSVPFLKNVRAPAGNRLSMMPHLIVDDAGRLMIVSKRTQKSTRGMTKADKAKRDSEKLTAAFDRLRGMRNGDISKVNFEVAIVFEELQMYIAYFRALMAFAS